MKSRSPAGALAAVLVAGLLTAPAGAGAGAAAAPPRHRVIVMLSDGAQAIGAQAMPKGKQLKLVNAVATSLSDSEIAAMRKAPGVRAVVPDTPVKAHTDVSVPLIGATEVRQRYAATGRGVVVAVIDSGVDHTHPDLRGRVVGGYDFVNGDTDPMDDNGHGTHVAGIIAGKAATPEGITGVAPEASITAYKVMNQWGEGWTSDIIAGIEAAADPANPHRADVINLSLGGPGGGFGRHRGGRLDEQPAPRQGLFGWASGPDLPRCPLREPARRAGDRRRGRRGLRRPGGLGAGR